MEPGSVSKQIAEMTDAECDALLSVIPSAPDTAKLRMDVFRLKPLWVAARQRLALQMGARNIVDMQVQLGGALQVVQSAYAKDLLASNTLQAYEKVLLDGVWKLLGAEISEEEQAALSFFGDLGAKRIAPAIARHVAQLVHNTHCPGSGA